MDTKTQIIWVSFVLWCPALEQAPYKEFIKSGILTTDGTVSVDDWTLYKMLQQRPCEAVVFTTLQKTILLFLDFDLNWGKKRGKATLCILEVSRWQVAIKRVVNITTLVITVFVPGVGALHLLLTANVQPEESAVNLQQHIISSCYLCWNCWSTFWWEYLLWKES